MQNDQGVHTTVDSTTSVKLPSVSSSNHCSEHVWPAAHGLLQFMRKQKMKGRMLELGAGTGWMALEYAQQHPDNVQITCTDHPDYMQALHECLSINQASNVDAKPLDWAEPGFLDGPWDYIIGSDLVYNRTLCSLITGCWAALLEQHPTAVVLYAHSLGRWQDSGFDWPLHEAAVAAGLGFEILQVGEEDVTDLTTDIEVPADQKVCVILRVRRGVPMPLLATRVFGSAVQAGEQRRAAEWAAASEEERAEIRMAEEIASIDW